VSTADAHRGPATEVPRNSGHPRWLPPLVSCWFP
jgi:hypothetical protein